MTQKSFKFVNEAAKRAFNSLPDNVRLQFSVDLRAVQQGEKPLSRFKDISGSVGAGAMELIENGSPACRAVYCVKFLQTVYILHAFEKTTNGVDRPNMVTAAKRYKLMKAEVDAAKKKTKR